MPLGETLTLIVLMICITVIICQFIKSDTDTVSYQYRIPKFSLKEVLDDKHDENGNILREDKQGKALDETLKKAREEHG